jgi:hypothetical protein
MMHGFGKLRIEEAFVEGIFSFDDIHEGKIIYDGGLTYQGHIKDFAAFGKGTLKHEEYLINSDFWNGETVERGKALTIYWITNEIKCSITGIVDCWKTNDNESLILIDAVELHNDIIQFKGSFQLFDFGDLEVNRIEGIKYFAGLPRYGLIHNSNSFPEATLDSLYDEKGILALTINDGTLELEDPDDEWPLINGKMNVHSEDGHILYVANFIGSVITNLLTISSRIPIFNIQTKEPLIDFISFEPIPFGEISFAFNTTDGNHVISRSTLDCMRDSMSAMMAHPLTRARIMRVFRVRATIIGGIDGEESP